MITKQMTMWLRFSVCMLLASTLLADDFSYLHRDGDSIYARAVNDVTQDDDILERETRQAASDEYNVTQCNYDNTQCCDVGASIQVLGRQLQYSHSLQRAAKLIHRMVRFMPRSLFVNITKTCKIGLFSPNHFPLNVFEEFQVPEACMTQCSEITLQDGTPYDCSEWCTTSEYPYSPNYHLNFLWAYGNISMMYVVETNVICQGFNPGAGSENYLMREFGFSLMTRVFDNNLLSRIETAYQSALESGNWGTIFNKYHYFMKATQVWFDGITKDDGVMFCLHIRDNNNNRQCEDLYAQRQNVKHLDRPMFDILNYVYNDNREYLESGTSLCDW